MTRPLTFGIQTMLEQPWAGLVADWQEYEADGWDSLWIPDHLMPPSGKPGPFLEAWVTLAALASLTERARIGVLVSSNTFRHPSVLAKQAVTVDHISGGRLALGLGAGWFQDEHDAFGLVLPPVGERVSQYAEALALLDEFLTHDTTSFEGDYYRMADAPNRPTPVQSPRMPIMVGAHGPRTISIAARHADIWNSRGTVDEMRERNDRMDAACEKARRDPGEVTRSVAYIPARTEERVWESVDRFASWVERYQAVGYTDFLFEEPPAEHRDTARRIARELLPELRRS
jgi:alkanesulfonate monooxygenase SsuD/methylene tetrahydromethanopterin reductase-like flavin-dependent oxidoreductase (luciferase family)